ncbi:MAG: DUF87 domain-containing protein [Rhizobiales bacterium]|nr:DUF87 domain-containing protein [Hyphomicrobiales bacterium]
MSVFTTLMETIEERNKKRFPVSSRIGEAIGASIGSAVANWRSESERTRNLRQMRPPGRSDGERRAQLLWRAAETGADRYLPSDLAGDAADVANALAQAERWMAEDAGVRAQAEVFWRRLRTAGLHPDLAAVDFEANWRGFGWHAGHPSATLNRLLLPVGAFGLAPLYHPTRFEQHLVDPDTGATQRLVQLDDYPPQCLDTPFAGMRWHEGLPHPAIPLTSEMRRQGIRAHACFVRLGIALDDWVALPLHLAAMDGNGAFNNYRLDVEAADACRYPMLRLGGITADVKLWQRHLDEASRIMGRPVEVAADPARADRIVLIDVRAGKAPTRGGAQDTVFGAEQFQDGRLYVGRCRDDDSDAWLDVADHPSTFIAGQTGSGKSNLLNVLIAGMLHNIAHYETIVLVDLKHGGEFGGLEGQLPNVRLVTEYEELPRLFQELNATIAARYREARAARQKRYPGKTIMVVFDEVATITHVPLATREAKAENAQLIADMASVLMKGRAARVKMIAATQRPHADAVPSVIRFNMGARLVGRVYERAAIANVFGDAQELEDIRPADFPAGCFYADLGDGRRRLIQVPFIADDLGMLLG